MLKRRLKEPFGKAGLTVAVIALVMALVGGAYAAGGLTKSQEKQVTKIAKKYAGKAGAAGINGINGTNGKDGAAGTNGKDGTPGASGTSATTASFNGAKGSCKEGGVEVKSASPTVNVCNGSPWTAGGTLPKGSTETGTWSASGVPAKILGAFPGLLASISFDIPLSAPLTNAEECDETGKPVCAVHIIGVKAGEGEENESPFVESGECSGTVLSPGAEEGHLCVFVGEHGNFAKIIPSSVGRLEDPSEFGAGTTGAVLNVVTSTEAAALVSGSWAVTAE